MKTFLRLWGEMLILSIVIGIIVFLLGFLGNLSYVYTGAAGLAIYCILSLTGFCALCMTIGENA